jgi:hypothetical protein
MSGPGHGARTEGSLACAADAGDLSAEIDACTYLGGRRLEGQAAHNAVLPHEGRDRAMKLTRHTSVRTAYRPNRERGV